MAKFSAWAKAPSVPGQAAQSIVLAAVAAFLLSSCSPPVKQFYPDIFYSEDHIYENKPLRFLLRFEGNWEIITDPNEMGKEAGALARQLARSGVELLFIGATVEGYHFTWGQAINLNEPVLEYAERIRRTSAKKIQNDGGLTVFVFGRNSAVKWIYDKNGSRIVEFFIAIGTYDIRIAFGTRTGFFEKFLPVYERILSTLEVTGGI